MQKLLQSLVVVDFIMYGDFEFGGITSITGPPRTISMSSEFHIIVIKADFNS